MTSSSSFLANFQQPILFSGYGTNSFVDSSISFLDEAHASHLALTISFSYQSSRIGPWVLSSAGFPPLFCLSLVEFCCLQCHNQDQVMFMFPRLPPLEREGEWQLKTLGGLRVDWGWTGFRKFREREMKDTSVQLLCSGAFERGEKVLVFAMSCKQIFLALLLDLRDKFEQTLTKTSWILNWYFVEQNSTL